MSDIVERTNNLLTYIDGVSDERDSVPLLIEVRKAWPKVKAEIERLRSEIKQLEADKTIISQTASDFLHEIERLKS